MGRSQRADWASIDAAIPLSWGGMICSTRGGQISIGSCRQGHSAVAARAQSIMELNRTTAGIDALSYVSSKGCIQSKVRQYLTPIPPIHLVPVILFGIVRCCDHDATSTPLQVMTHVSSVTSCCKITLAQHPVVGASPTEAPVLTTLLITQCILRHELSLVDDTLYVTAPATNGVGTSCEKRWTLTP